MTAKTGLFVQQLADGSGATAKDARIALAGLLAKNADGTVKTGVLADGLGPVVTGTAGMAYSVRKCVAVSKMSEANGPTLIPNDGDVSVSTTASPGSNSRIDVIYAVQRHLTADGGSDTVNTPVIGVVQGAAAAVPAAPSIPTGAVELGRAVVTSGATATSGLTITQGATTTANTGLTTTDWADFNLGNLWVPFGAPFDAPGYRLRHGRVEFRGVMRSGGVGAVLNVALTSEFQPANSKMFLTTGGVGAARLQVSAVGQLTVEAYIASGTNGFVSLDGIAYQPK